MSKTVLVVDDEPKIRVVVHDYLAEAGYRVVEAADGATALDRAADQRPDLVVLDLGLPGGVDGSPSRARADVTGPGRAQQRRHRDSQARVSTRGPGGGPPPWWPEGEAWPPPNGPWSVTGRRFRRRFLLAFLAFLVVLLVLLGIGVLVGLAASGWWRGEGVDRPGARRWEDRPGAGLLFLLGLLVVPATVAAIVTYRRVTRPVGALFQAASQVAAGDYDVHVRPDGPRELRHFTERFNDMAARLAEAEEQRRLLLAEVTHELRTPLALLQGGIEAQLDGVHPRDDAHLESLLEEARRLGRLIDDLHTVALADAGRVVLHREPTDVGTLAAEAVAGHAALGERRHVTVVARSAPDLPIVEVDPARLHQVLANLLANALRHAPDFGTVEVLADAVGAGVQLVVQDDGPGFAPGQLGEVFDRFTRSPDSRGSGIGLSIARDLVQAHGGTITAANRPTGGAAITVTFPVLPPADRI